MKAESIRYYGQPRSSVPQYYSFLILTDYLTEDEREVYYTHKPVITKLAAQTFISGQYENIDDPEFINILNIIFNKETEDCGAKVNTINNLIKRFLQSEIFITDKADSSSLSITETVARNLQFDNLLKILKLENYLENNKNKIVHDVVYEFIIEHGKKSGWII